MVSDAAITSSPKELRATDVNWRAFERWPGLRLLFNLFAKSGAKAVVNRDVLPMFFADDWKRVAGTTYFFFMLSGPR
jgi:hypothetical protein